MWVREFEMEIVLFNFISLLVLSCQAQELAVDGIAVDSMQRTFKSKDECESLNQSCLQDNSCISLCCLDLQNECLCCLVDYNSSYRCPPPSRECATCDNYTCSEDGIDFITAAKIAILIALCVTFVAVLLAIYRAFIRPRCCGHRSGPRPRPSETRSLNSIQRFVLSRLEERPPPYEFQPEKPPAYEEVVVGETSSRFVPSISGTIAERDSSTLPLEPPSYQEAVQGTMLSLDPTFLLSSGQTTDLARSDSQSRSSIIRVNSSESQVGLLNEAYEFEEIPLDDLDNVC